MPYTDVESNTPCPCSTSPARRGAKTLAKKVATGLMILAVLLASLATFGDHKGLELSEDTCPVPGAYNSKVWKLAREFRRLTRSAARKLKRIDLAAVQEKLFSAGLKDSRSVARDDACSIKDGTSLSHAYPCTCGSNTCSDGQACTETLSKCEGTQLELEIVSASHVYDSDWYTTSDPYVKCFLDGKEDSTKFETHHLVNSHHPVWNFKHDIPAYDGESLKCFLFDKSWCGSTGFCADDEISHITFAGSIIAQPWRHDELIKFEGATAEIAAKLHPESSLRIKAFVHTPDPAPFRGPFWWACEHRVRKDWVDLTEAEKVLYFEAVNKLKTTPRERAPDNGPGNNIYDTFVMIHEENNNKAYAHGTSGFLPWHRKFLLELESAMRSVDDKFKCVTLPYWDWTSETFGCKNHFDPNSALDTPGCETYHAASDLLTRFGGPGDATRTSGAFGSSGSGPVGCVTTGPFAGWVDHNGKCLSRGVNWKVSDQKPFTGRVAMLKILHYSDYGNYRKEGFRSVLEGLPHGATHNYLGGHMRSFISPADPIFFSHHGYIDKLWTIWQDCHGHDTKEVKELLQTDGDNPANLKYYRPTQRYTNDKVNDPMLFFLESKGADIGGTATCPTQGKFCQKSEQACKQCVGSIDSWCNPNDWDQTCCNLCTNQRCAVACGAEQAPDVDLNVVGDAYLKDWVVAEKSPADVHTVKAMAGARSYSYAQDEIEKHLLEMAPESLGECKIETPHASSMMSLSVLAETRSFHHNNDYRGKVARSYAAMIARSFDETKKNMPAMDKEQQFQHAMNKAQRDECEMMAPNCNGDYKREYNCKVDQPRFWIPWIGNETWTECMKDDHCKHVVFQDLCCAGDEEALQPAAVKATMSKAMSDR